MNLTDGLTWKAEGVCAAFEEPVNNDLLVNGARNLRDYLQFRGYCEVQVDFKTTNYIRNSDTKERM